MIYFANMPLNQKWNIHAEAQYRNYNFVGDLQQLLLRGGVGYNLSDNNHNLLAGYAYILHEPYISGTEEKNSFGEHRLYQQFIARDNVGRVFIQHRYRTEERFYNNNFQFRMRYFLALNIPINNKIMVKNTFYASLYNEIFMVLSSPFFERNRFYTALGYVASADLRFEIGYMWQRVQSNYTFESFSRPQIQIVCFNTLRFWEKR